MLSFTYLKIFFNELYACSLAFFHLYITILLRFFNANIKHSRRPQSSVDRTRTRTTLANTLCAAAQPETCSSPSVPSRCPTSCAKPLVDDHFNGLFVLNSKSTSGICDLSYDSNENERTIDCLLLPGNNSEAADISALENKQSPLPKYTFKRKRHTSQSVGRGTEVVGGGGYPSSACSSPESAASIRRRIKPRSRSALRPMLLFQDPAIDLRPLLLPEHVAQRSDLQMTQSDGSISYSTHYAFQSPLESRDGETSWIEDDLEDYNDDISVPALGTGLNGEFMDTQGEVRDYDVMDMSF